VVPCPASGATGSGVLDRFINAKWNGLLISLKVREKGFSIKGVPGILRKD
jgi:hypothetical protein